VRMDPRARTSPEALKARFDASQTLAELARSFAQGDEAVEGLDHEMTAIKDAIKKGGNVPQDVAGRVDAASKQVDTLKGQFRAGFGGPKFQYLDLAGQLQASTAAPTDAQLTTIEHLTTELQANLNALNTLISRDLAQLESDLRSQNINAYGVRPVALPKVP